MKVAYNVFTRPMISRAPGQKACSPRSGTTRSQHQYDSGDQTTNGIGASPTWAVHGNEKCVTKIYHGTRQSSVRAVPW